MCSNVSGEDKHSYIWRLQDLRAAWPIVEAEGERERRNRETLKSGYTTAQSFPQKATKEMEAKP
jgi:hypothetical protein